MNGDFNMKESKKLKVVLPGDNDFTEIDFEIEPTKKQLEFCFYCNVKESCPGSFLLSVCKNFPDGPPLSWQEIHSIAHEMRKQFEFEY